MLCDRLYNAGPFTVNTSAGREKLSNLPPSSPLTVEDQTKASKHPKSHRNKSIFFPLAWRKIPPCAPGCFYSAFRQRCLGPAASLPPFLPSSVFEALLK